MDTIIFIAIIYIIIAVSIKISKMGKSSPRQKTVIKVIKEKAPRQEKPRPTPDYDEIEYQRGRLQSLYELYEILDEKITTVENTKDREKLIKKIISLDAQIRRAQKIIAKEYAKANQKTKGT